MSYLEKLSIIIPTKNRQVYALDCIKTIMSFGKDGFEVVVQDNSDDKSLWDMLVDYQNDERLVYNYSNEVLSFCKNFEMAIDNSHGDYLIMIGDDDCLCKEAIELTNILRKKNIEAVTYPTETTYKWPNAVKDNEGLLVIRDTKPYVKVFGTNDAINNMMSVGDYDYQKYHFPKIYHGIIKRSSFDKVKDVTGHYFGGLTPDIYSAISLSFYIKNIVFINYPFSIPGTCARSGSADSLSGRHTGELSSAPHFRGTVNYQWEKEIPYIYTVDTIWAETALKAIKENNQESTFNRDECLKLITVISSKYSQFNERVIDFYCDYYKEDKNNITSLVNTNIKKIINKRKIKRIKSLVKQVLNGRHPYHNIDNMSKAMEIVESKLNKYSTVFKLVEELDNNETN